MIRNKVRNFSTHNLATLVPVFLFAGLTSCVGTQAARDLTKIELARMSEYQQLIDNKITAEEAYYNGARKELVENLQEARKQDVEKDFVDRRAIVIADQWENSSKKTLSEKDLLEVLDGISFQLRTAQARMLEREDTITERYLNALEKLEYQRKKLEEIRSALGELNSDLSTIQKAAFLYDYAREVEKEFEKLRKEAEKPDTSGTAPISTPTN
jgi:hypothetical protein